VTVMLNNVLAILYRKLYDVLFQGNFANNNTCSCGDLWQFTAKLIRFKLIEPFDQHS